MYLELTVYIATSRLTGFNPHCVNDEVTVWAEVLNESCPFLITFLANLVLFPVLTFHLIDI